MLVAERTAILRPPADLHRAAGRERSLARRVRDLDDEVLAPERRQPQAQLVAQERDLDHLRPKAIDAAGSRCAERPLFRPDPEIDLFARRDAGRDHAVPRGERDAALAAMTL